MSYWINITVALISFALAAVIGIVLIPFLKKSILVRQYLI